MKNLNTFLKSLVAMIAIAVMFTFTSCSDDDEEPAPTQNLYELLSDDTSLSQLKTWIDSDAELKAYLEGETAYTFFAPNDAAFDKLKATLGTDDLTSVSPTVIGAVLRFHFVVGENASSAIANGTFSTIQGESIVGNGDGTILTGGSDDKVEIVTADVKATNGVMHVTETILVPPTIFATIGLNLGTAAQPILLGAPFTDFLSIIQTADSDVPTGEDAISAILADNTQTLTVFSIANDVFAGVAAANGIDKATLLGMYTANAATARAFLLNQMSDDATIQGDGLTNGTMITMMSGATYYVSNDPDNIDATTNPYGIALAQFSPTNNTADPAKYSPLYGLDIIDVNNTGAAVNGSVHVSAPLQ